MLIKSEVEKLSSSTITEASKSPGRVQVLAVRDGRLNRRELNHYNRTINRFTHLVAYLLPCTDKLIEKISQYKVYTAPDLKSIYRQIPFQDSRKDYIAFEVGCELYQFCHILIGMTNGIARFQRVIDDIMSEEQLQETVAYADNLAICVATVEEYDHNLKGFVKIANKYGTTFNESKNTIRTR